MRRDAASEIHLAVGERVHTCRYLRDRFDDYRLDPGRTAPVPLVRFQHDLVIFDPPDDPVRAGPDRIGGDVGRALVLHVARRHHVDDAGELGVENGVGRLRPDVDGQVVDDVDALDGADPTDVLGLRRRVEHPLDVPLHDLGVEGLAVGELDPLAELELPRALVDQPV